MIKINDIVYSNYSYKVNLKNYEIISCGKKENDISPSIIFTINDEISIELELVISKLNIESLIINDKMNIEKYVTEIIYGNKRVFSSLSDCKYNSNITRVDNTKFKLEFNINSTEDALNINIDTIIKIL